MLLCFLLCWDGVAQHRSLSQPVPQLSAGLPLPRLAWWAGVWPALPAFTSDCCEAADGRRQLSCGGD